jgi:predicted RNase H-like HicB family nuclease
VNYPIVIHKDPDSDFGVTVPDLPGCFSAGSTLDEAIAMAHEAIEAYLETIIEDGQAVPDPSPVETYRNKKDFAGGIWAVVSVDPSRLMKAKRVNITMPERVLATVDRFAADTGETRSGLLVRAVTDYIASRRKAVGKGKRTSWK